MRAIELPFLMIYNGTRTQVRLRVLITEHRSLVSIAARGTEGLAAKRSVRPAGLY